ncbi:MAG: dihydrolipoamide acetyltransferase [Deltaproteobacteria bacterium]|nr:dihydrolipoamide acetyltransferase [Deltaproteobacteria bacterium]
MNKSSKILGAALVALCLGAPGLVRAEPNAARDEQVGDGDASQGGAPSTTSPAVGGETVEDSESALKLRDLEEKVSDLKERVFRSKARLILLKETVMNGVISGARARIVHRNEMGSAFVLRQVNYSLDGAPLLSKQDEGDDLDGQEEIELFNGSIVPGNHNLAVYLVYQGNGYGIFSYLRGYTFKIRSSYAFTAEEGKTTTLKAVAYEKGGITADLKDRPAIRYDVEVKQEARVAAEPSPVGATQE